MYGATLSPREWMRFLGISRWPPDGWVEGEFTGLLGIVSDITDHKHAENALRESEQEKAAILSGLRHVAVEYLDPSMRIIWVNEAVQMSLDYRWTS